MKPVNVIVITLAMEDASGMKVGAEINARVCQIIVALTKSTKQVSVKSGKSLTQAFVSVCLRNVRPKAKYAATLLGFRSLISKVKIVNVFSCALVKTSCPRRHGPRAKILA